MSKERYTIGRLPDNDVRIDNPAVSGHHSLIINILNDSFLEDLNSTNGTYVNGTRIAETTLKPGDEVAVGPVKFFVQINGEPAEFEPPDPSAPDSDVMPLGEDDLFLLEDDDFVEDDAISALESMTDDDDEPPTKA